MRASLLCLAIVELLFAQQAHASSEPAGASIADTGRICPLPRCSKCPTVDQIRAPGVGFALQMGHGTVVLRHHNGHYQSIARVAGSPAYSALMSSLASGPQNRDPDHLDSVWDKWGYVRRHAQRRLNKMLGRPATPETAILAVMVSTLKTAAETQLEQKQVEAAVLSSPDQIRLTAQEITDIFDYLGMTNLMAVPDTLEDLYDTSAAYAGLGMGLCTNYTDPYACEQEESRFDYQRVLHLDFSPDSLGGSVKSLRTAKGGLVDKTFIDTELRFDAGRDADVECWKAIAFRIRSFVQGYRPQITQLLLTGPSVSNQHFKNSLKLALHDLADPQALLVLDDQDGVESEDFEFITARGAAEFAKRRQEGPVRCAEDDACKRVRDEAGRSNEFESDRWTDL